MIIINIIHHIINIIHHIIDIIHHIIDIIIHFQVPARSQLLSVEVVLL